MRQEGISELFSAISTTSVSGGTGCCLRQRISAARVFNSLRCWVPFCTLPPLRPIRRRYALTCGDKVSGMPEDTGAAAHFQVGKLFPLTLCCDWYDCDRVMKTSFQKPSFGGGYGINRGTGGASSLGTAVPPLKNVRVSPGIGAGGKYRCPAGGHTPKRSNSSSSNTH
jgi:hypothetical protein